MRLHVSVIFKNLSLTIPFIFVTSYYIGMKKASLSLALFIFITSSLIFLIIYFLIWKNTYVYFNNDILKITKGKLIKKVLNINISDIDNINIKTNIFEKALGTSHIKLDLHNSSPLKLTFKNEETIKIRNQILKKMGKKGKIDFQSDFAYNKKDVLKHLFLSTDLISFLIIIIIIIFVIYELLGPNKGINSLPLIIFLLIITFLPLIFSFIKTYLNYSNFKCKKEKQSIRLSSGKFTTYKYLIPLNKINAVIIHKSIQARILGYSCIEVINGSSLEKTLISLYVKDKDALKIFKKLLPNFNLKINLNSQTENAFKYYLMNKIIFMILGIVFAYITYGYSLLIIPLGLIISYLQYKTKKLGFNKKMLVFENGLLNKKKIFVKYENIELLKVISLPYKLSQIKINIRGNIQFISGLFDEKLIQKAKSYFV